MIEKQSLEEFTTKLRIGKDVCQSATEYTKSLDTSRLWQCLIKDCPSSFPFYFRQGFYPCDFFSQAKGQFDSDGISVFQGYFYLYLSFFKYSYLHIKEKCPSVTDVIFTDTFSRLAAESREYFENVGKDGIYDYHFFANHLTGNILRLGSFEYGLGTYDGKKAIIMHIPQGCSLELKDMQSSFCLARQYFGNAKIICDSWLLYPEHLQVLGENSKISLLAKQFDIVSTSESYDYKELFHIFGRCADYSNPDKLLKNTRLQRFYIQRITNKMPIGSATGILKQ